MISKNHQLTKNLSRGFKPSLGKDWSRPEIYIYNKKYEYESDVYIERAEVVSVSMLSR